MQNAAASYARTAQITQSPRELEASLLLKAAYRLQVVGDEWHTADQALVPALTYNRRIWTILSTSATEPTNPLPDGIKVAIASLAGFIFQRTISVMAEPAPEKLAALIRINRDIAAGLRGSAAAPALAAAAG
ncbi:flagellar biosynthesis regulator FlaF [Enterovirga rhinocerotis]|uniref:Flagellar protein FlaF n=1 Tax=Enterovirga rhinocerotis TaxID=1339210 RepID=A0A4R7C4Q9_9HYPH|nr:flagellar biosynthesis regulator FlaF [Enterovirga rhinocerotis]TDR93151.1 flagellar protein FlaF [Enterovirga rhinocerotis]